MKDLVGERRLAAIMITDVVGYTRMMAADEIGTLRTLTNVRREVIEPSIAARGGRIVKTMGDGLLVEFSSVVDATLCAIEVQRAMPAHATLTRAKHPMTLRIGINIGDVIVQQGDLYGDGVNVAARLQTLAEPGGLCLSRAAVDQIGRKIDAPFTEIGTPALKNVDRPIEAFLLSPVVIAALPRYAPPKRSSPLRITGSTGSRAKANARSGLLGPVIAVASALLLLGGAYYFYENLRDGALADNLEAVLLEANVGHTSRERLVTEYLSLGNHKALAIAPAARGHWWTGEWPDVETAVEKALERCQLNFGEPCAPVAAGGAMVRRGSDGKWRTRDMPKIRYAGEFDLAKVPILRDVDLQQQQVRQYAALTGPKAMALHPHGRLAIASNPSLHQAEQSALDKCNKDLSRRDGDGPCYLYAVGNRVVLHERRTAASARE
jgi:class 3 adenylate cyclase